MRERIYFDLHIPRDEYLKHYSGAASMVNARARDGRRVQFPANVLRRFVTHEGICASFAIDIDENAKLLAVHKL